MGSKRPKKPKQDLEKKNDDLVDVGLNHFNADNAVTPQKPVKRKRKEESDQVPKKVKRTNPPEIVNGEIQAKKVRSKKKKTKARDTLNGITYEQQTNGEAIGEELKVENNTDVNVNSVGIKSPNKKPNAITWPDADIKELINQIERNIPEKDMLAYRSRVEKLNWDNVTFKNYTAEECKKTWCLVQKRMRRFRLLSEILSDARHWINGPKLINYKKSKKRHPEMPRRPLSAYLLFYVKKKDQIISENPGVEKSDLTKLAGQMFKNLPPEEKEKYEKLAAGLKEEYLQKRQIFYENHPELAPPHMAAVLKPPKIEQPKIEKPVKVEKAKPAKVERAPKPEKPKKIEKPAKTKKLKDKPPKRFQTAFGLYLASELKKKGESVEKSAFREQCKAEYKLMPVNKKVVWINLAEQDLIRYQEEAKLYKQTHPEYEIVSVKSVLTKHEKAVKERAAGKPAKPANSAYGLYSRVMLNSEEIKTVHPKDRMNVIAGKWKECSEQEKSYYQDQMIDLNEQYKLDYAAYVNTLPDDEKKKILDSQRKKKSKSRGRDRRRSGKQGKRKSPRKAKPVKEEIKFKEPEQPPISACKYFATVFKGEGDPVQAWKALSSEEKKHYEKELVKKKQAYIVEFETFLKSLSKEELEAFSKSRQQQIKSDEEDEGDDEDDDSSVCSSSSDGEHGDEDDAHESESE